MSDDDQRARAYAVARFNEAMLADPDTRAAFERNAADLRGVPVEPLLPTSGPRCTCGHVRWRHTTAAGWCLYCTHCYPDGYTETT